MRERRPGAVELEQIARSSCREHGLEQAQLFRKESLKNSVFDPGGVLVERELGRLGDGGPMTSVAIGTLSGPAAAHP